ncbi:MAG: hypothetical protein AABO41_20765 [Acidobacteriota bacterium]
MNTIITGFPPVTAYELCDPTGVLEAEFEAVVIRVLMQLYTDCIVFPFRPDVRYDDAIWNPDLALVDRNHGYWFVIEVEIATHHLEKHVLPQVTAFSEGMYGVNAAEQLARGVGINLSQAHTLLSVIPRDVVVVSNRYDERWTTKLDSVGVQHLAIASYRNVTTAQVVHKIDGELIPAQRSIGFGKVRAEDGVIVTQIGSFWKEGVFEIIGPEGAAKWICSILEGRAWLMKKRGLIEFHDQAFVQFLLRHDGSLLVRAPYAHLGLRTVQP